MRADRGMENNALVFDDIDVRHAFISKVLTTMGLMLAVTVGIVVLFMFVSVIRIFFLKHFYIFYIAAIIAFIICIILVCCLSVARSVPINYILLFIFTICKGIMIGYCAVQYAPFIVLVSFGTTCVLCLALALFACQTRIDFTACYALIIALVVILLIGVILFLIFPSKGMLVGLCCVGLFLFSIFLICDIQMMVGGNHKNQYDEEDYIIAALCIYIDIINIFLCILMIAGVLDS